MRGDRSWQRAMDEALEWWRDALGARDRVAEGWQSAIDRDPHEQVLRRAGLRYEGLFEFVLDHGGRGLRHVSRLSHVRWPISVAP